MKPRVPDAVPTIYLIGGCNGAGKTTFAREFLPKEVNCLRFMNADEIARGLSPFAPESAGIRAGRVLLAEVGETIRLRSTFGWESTLAGHAQLKFLNRARGAGFEVEVHYLFVASIDICLQRIRQRVREGGHDVPARDVERRFKRSLANLVHLYLPIADRWTVWNAGTSAPHPILQSPGASLGDVSRILAGR